MSLRKGIFLLVGILILLPSSCAKLPERPMPEEGDVAIEKMPAVDSIPAEWGDLVAVSVNANVGHIYQLWFQDAAGNIRIVFYNIRNNELLTQGRVIPRSGEVG